MISELSLKSQHALKREILQAKAEYYKRNPMTWLLGDKYAPAQVFTHDEHDPSVAPKPFPDKAYIRQMIEWWLSIKMACWEKSRQMMASWLFCALYLHDAQFGTN